MPVIIDDTGGGSGYGTGDAEAPFTFLLAEPTLHAFSPEVVEDAQRRTYQADQSGVVYSLLIAGNVYKDLTGTGSVATSTANLIATVAGQLAATWDANATVPGVVDIAETQTVSPLGSLDDVYQVAIESTSGRSTAILEVATGDIRSDVFAQIVGAARASLDAAEAAH